MTPTSPSRSATRAAPIPGSKRTSAPRPASSSKTTASATRRRSSMRPENLRMVNLLDIHVEAITHESLREYDRVAMVDVQPHYFGGLIDRVDLVIDHHPEQPGYTAVFKDIRPDYGSTSTILTEHLRAVD